MDHLLWQAYQDDGSCVDRWNWEEGDEQTAPPWSTRQVHVYTLYPPTVDYRLHIPRGAQFRCGTRDGYFFAGWEMPDSVGAWLFVSPVGELELAPWEAHHPRFAIQYP